MGPRAFLRLIFVTVTCLSTKLVKNWFALRTTHSHVSIPPNQNGAVAKDGFVRRENGIQTLDSGVRVQAWRAAV